MNKERRFFIDKSTRLALQLAVGTSLLSSSAHAHVADFDGNLFQSLAWSERFNAILVVSKGTYSLQVPAHRRKLTEVFQQMGVSHQVQWLSADRILITQELKLIFNA